jgi:PAS domain S-box-containing protein
MNHTIQELEQLFSTPVFQSFFDAAPDAILVVNHDGIIVHYNQRAQSMFAAPAKALEACNVDQLLPQAMRHKHQTLRQGYVHQPTLRPMGMGLDLRAQRMDGQEFPVEISLSPLRLGATQLVLAIVRDISPTIRFKETQEELQREQALASMTQMALSDANFESFCNTMLQYLHERVSADWVSLIEIDEGQKQFKPLQSYPASPSFRAANWMPRSAGHIVDQILLSGKAHIVADVEAQGLNPHPHVSQLKLRCSMGAPIMHGGRIALMLMASSKEPDHYKAKDSVFIQTMANVLANAYQRFRAEESVQTARRLESIGRLTGGIAHDFNNLLTVISGNLQLLEMVTEGNEAAQKSIAAAFHASQRGAELTKKLLSFARKDVLQPQRCDVSRLMHGSYELLERTLSTNIRLSLQLPGKLPMIDVDPVMFESCMLNIALNARDAMPAGGSLTLSACAKSAPTKLMKPAVLITITDTGHGMSQETKERIFDPFFTTKPSGQGTGLGLSTLYGFMKRSGGTIKVNSEMGRGTSFELYFPMSEAQHLDDPIEQIAPAAKSRIATAVVLLIEDDAAVADVGKRLLEDMGHQVILARTHSQALEYWGKYPEINMIVSDIVLGNGENGVKTVTALRAAGAKLPVVFVSGYSRDELSDSKRPEFPHIFLAKPYSQEQLLQAIQEALSPDSRALG